MTQKFAFILTPTSMNRPSAYLRRVILTSISFQIPETFLKNTNNIIDSLPYSGVVHCFGKIT